MAPSLASLRNKIQNRIFGSIASTGTIINISSSTDKWGDRTSSVSSSSSVSIVPYNMFSREEFVSFGDLHAGELDIILPYTTTVGVDDLIDYDGSRYVIKEFEKYPYQGGVLAYAVRVAKQL